MKVAKIVWIMLALWPSLAHSQEGVRTAGDPCQKFSFVSAQLKDAYIKLIKQRLKAPTTARFENVEADPNGEKDGVCLWAMTADVTSQNSFGAMLTQKMPLLVGCSSSKEVCFPIDYKLK